MRIEIGPNLAEVLITLVIGAAVVGVFYVILR